MTRDNRKIASSGGKLKIEKAEKISELVGGWKEIVEDLKTVEG